MPCVAAARRCTCVCEISAAYRITSDLQYQTNHELPPVPHASVLAALSALNSFTVYMTSEQRV